MHQLILLNCIDMKIRENKTYKVVFNKKINLKVLFSELIISLYINDHL